VNFTPKLTKTLLLFLATTICINAQEWNLVWADEFDADGAVNNEKWFHQTQLPNGYSWYNNELQHYTDEIENSYVDNGTLKIVGIKEDYTDQGHTKSYTSARLNSKFAFKYGKVEVRAKLPYGQGTWPAIWTLGKNITEPGAYWFNQGYGTTSWPGCGEIDIMEHWGSNQNYVQSATHTPSSYGGTINHGGQYIPTVSSEFHTYGLIWTEEQLVFSVDDVIHYTYNPPIKDSDTWPFDTEQFLLLNLAIAPDITSNFQQSTLEIDYVRVYQGGEGGVGTSPIYGCMDENAINFTPNATTQNMDQYGNNLCTYASCNEVPYNGCMYSNAFAGWNENFNAQDCLNYGGTPCENNTANSVGCMDQNATNYNADATEQAYDQWNNILCTYSSCNDVPDDGCMYADAFAGWHQNFNAQDCINYGGTPCENVNQIIEGCTNVEATNYNPDATADDGSCSYDIENSITDIVFSIPFGGVIYNGSSYMNPTGSESWAGFANEDLSIYPFSFENGGTISFTANTNGGNAELFFRFEHNPYPDVDPNFSTSTITVSNNGEYTLNIPSQGANTFSTFLLYIVTQNIEVTLSNVTVISSGSDTSSGNIDGCTDITATNYNIEATNDDGTCQYPCNFDWDVNVTDQNHSLFVSGVWTDPNGVTLTDSSALGVFYQNDAGNFVCAGYTYNTGELLQISIMGNDATTNQIDGLSSGEPLILRIWDASNCQEYSVDYNFTSGPEVFSVNGITFIESVTATTISSDEQIIALPEGWSLFSTYVLPTESDMAAILAPMLNELIIAKDYTGSAYLPEWNFNGIGNLEIGQGYQIKTSAETNLAIVGLQIMPEDQPIIFESGWNIIGYLRTEQAPANLVLGELVSQGNLIIAKNSIGDAYLPEWDFNGIGFMKPGEGYQIKTYNAGSIQYISNDSVYE